MRNRTHIRRITLGKWFPANDHVAVCVARLCILREDLYIEQSAFTPEAIPVLDANSLEWRRLYFFRNHIKTLREIDGALSRLQQDADFKRLLESQPTHKKDEFSRLVKEMKAAEATFKTIRDTTGGHVLESAVKKALENIGSDDAGFIEIGTTHRSTHYRFAYELTLAVLAGEVPAEQINEEIRKRLLEHVPLMRMIDLVLEIYITSRHLS